MSYAIVYIHMFNKHEHVVCIYDVHMFGGSIHLHCFWRFEDFKSLLEIHESFRSPSDVSGKITSVWFLRVMFFKTIL